MKSTGACNGGWRLIGGGLQTQVEPRMVNEKRSGPLFVVGMWRSGTSLLYTLLNKHPEIGLMYEADLPLLPGLFRNSGGKQDWLERWEFSRISRFPAIASIAGRSRPAFPILRMQRMFGSSMRAMQFGERNLLITTIRSGGCRRIP